MITKNMGFTTRYPFFPETWIITSTLICFFILVIVSISFSSIIGALPAIGTTPQLPAKPFSPEGISVDSKTGNIFVADINNNRIKKLDNNFGFIKDWGAYGSGNGQFKSPYGVAVDTTTHDVYVTDLGNNRIQKFTSNGIFIKAWGKQGSGDGYFVTPRGIAVDSSTHEVYVADTGNHTIKKFQLTNPCPADTIQIVFGVCFITKWGSWGPGNGQFKAPIGVAVDSSTHEVYVADAGNERIQKFTKTGNYITKWGNYGSGNGNFNEPYGIALDATTHQVYTAEDEGYRIQKFQFVNPCPSSTIQIVSGVCFITKWGNQGSGIGQFYHVFGVAIDSSHNVFVADTFNHRIQKFTNNGAFIAKWP